MGVGKIKPDLGVAMKGTSMRHHPFLPLRGLYPPVYHPPDDTVARPPGPR
jgi:hypothetical protein